MKIQNQTILDQINYITSVFRSLQNQYEKKESLINELSIQRKDTAHLQNAFNICHLLDKCPILLALNNLFFTVKLNAFLKPDSTHL